MEENPYKAPQTEGGGRPPPSRFWKRFADLVLLIVLGIVIGVPVAVGIISVFAEIERRQMYEQQP